MSKCIEITRNVVTGRVASARLFLETCLHNFCTHGIGVVRRPGSDGRYTSYTTFLGNLGFPEENHPLKGGGSLMVTYAGDAGGVGRTEFKVLQGGMLLQKLRERFEHLKCVEAARANEESAKQKEKEVESVRAEIRQEIERATCKRKAEEEAVREAEFQEREREKREFDVKIQRLECEKSVAEASLKEISRNRDREKRELEWAKEGAAATADSLEVISRERYREKRELGTTIERLKQDKATAEANLIQESAERNREKRAFEAVIAAADVECREYKKAKHDSELEIERLEQQIVLVEASLETETSARGRENEDSKAAIDAAEAKSKEERCHRERENRQLEATIARLQEEKIVAEAKVEKLEAKNTEFRMIIKQLKEEEAAARRTHVLKSHVVEHVKGEVHA